MSAEIKVGARGDLGQHLVEFTHRLDSFTVVSICGTTE